MNNCADIQAELSAYLDSELNASERAALDSHLASCPACQATLSDLRHASAALATLPKVKAPAGLAAEIQSAIRAQSRGDIGTFSPERKPYRWRWMPIVFSSLAALILLAVLAFVVVPAISRPVDREVALKSVPPIDAKSAAANTLPVPETAPLSATPARRPEPRPALNEDLATDSRRLLGAKEKQAAPARADAAHEDALVPKDFDAKIAPKISASPSAATNRLRDETTKLRAANAPSSDAPVAASAPRRELQPSEQQTLKADAPSDPAAAVLEKAAPAAPAPMPFAPARERVAGDAVALTAQPLKFKEAVDARSAGEPLDRLKTLTDKAAAGEREVDRETADGAMSKRRASAASEQKPIAAAPRAPAPGRAETGAIAETTSVANFPRGQTQDVVAVTGRAANATAAMATKAEAASASRYGSGPGGGNGAALGGEKEARLGTLKRSERAGRIDRVDVSENADSVVIQTADANTTVALIRLLAQACGGRVADVSSTATKQTPQSATPLAGSMRNGARPEPAPDAGQRVNKDAVATEETAVSQTRGVAQSADEFEIVVPAARRTELLAQLRALPTQPSVAAGARKKTAEAAPSEPPAVAAKPAAKAPAKPADVAASVADQPAPEAHIRIQIKRSTDR